MCVSGFRILKKIENWFTNEGAIVIFLRCVCVCIYFHSGTHGTFCAFTACEYNILGEHSMTSAS